MEPKTLYFSVVITAMIMVAGCFYASWWYDHYTELKAWRSRYLTCKSLDHAIMMHKVAFAGVLFALLALTIWVWFVQ